MAASKRMRRKFCMIQPEYSFECESCHRVLKAERFPFEEVQKCMKYMRRKERYNPVCKDCANGRIEPYATLEDLRTQNEKLKNTTELQKRHILQMSCHFDSVKKEKGIILISELSN